MTDVTSNVYLNKTPLEEGEQIGGMIFSNANKAVTLGNRTFRFDQTIDSYRFGGGLLTASQRKEPQQRLTILLDGKEHTYVCDHRREWGWRWYGTRPILEIHDAASNERYWFQFRPQMDGVDVWCRLTPLIEPPTAIQMAGHLRRMECVGNALLSVAAVIGTIVFYLLAIFGDFGTH